MLLTATQPFLGYRLQPKNRRFFLQFQCAPLTLNTISFAKNRYNPYTQTYVKPDDVVFIKTPFTPLGQYNNNFISSFEIRLGINLNRLQDTTTQNPAYEAPKNEKLALQHAFYAGLNISYFGITLPVGYDLRWHRPQKVDFAGNINLKIFSWAYNPTPELQALALFGEGNTCMEAGLSVNYTSHNKTYFSNLPDFVSLGIPLGFRYQPKKGFFMRIYAIPYRDFITPNPYYVPNERILSGASLNTYFGYTF